MENISTDSEQTPESQLQRTTRPEPESWSVTDWLRQGLRAAALRSVHRLPGGPRAVFDEQLRTTLSFEDAFARAVPIIKQREIDAKKDDGFSNPQISIGSEIRSVLDELADQAVEP